VWVQASKTRFRLWKHLQNGNVGSIISNLEPLSNIVLMKIGCVVVLTGATDYVFDGLSVVSLKKGCDTWADYRLPVCLGQLHRNILCYSGTSGFE